MIFSALGYWERWHLWPWPGPLRHFQKEILLSKPLSQAVSTDEAKLPSRPPVSISLSLETEPLFDLLFFLALSPQLSFHALAYFAIYLNSTLHSKPNSNSISFMEQLLSEITITE